MQLSTRNSDIKLQLLDLFKFQKQKLCSTLTCLVSFFSLRKAYDEKQERQGSKERKLSHFTLHTSSYYLVIAQRYVQAFHVTSHIFKSVFVNFFIHIHLLKVLMYFTIFFHMKFKI